MTEKEKMRLEDTLLQLGMIIREKSIQKYDFGRIYRAKLDESLKAETKYMKMQSQLTEEQEQIIEDMLDFRTEVAGYELTINYLAGLLDGIVFLRDSGLLDMYIMDETNEDAAEDKKNGCYLIALFPEKEGCLAVKMNNAKEMEIFAQDWKDRGIDMCIISCPEEYQKYEPYRFSVSLEAFEEELESIIAGKECEDDRYDKGKVDSELSKDTRKPEEIL